MRKISSFMNGVFISKTKLFPSKGWTVLAINLIVLTIPAKNSNLRFWIVIYAKKK